MATIARPQMTGAHSGSLENGEEHAFRDQLRRLLDSPEFSSSRRLSDFLAFISEAALIGREDLGQYEIAEEFLRRGGDFNPLDDASVRKLASQTRRKLESYYEDQGRHDPVLVTLPLRNYVPRYRSRGRTIDDPNDAPTQPATEPDTHSPAASAELEPNAHAEDSELAAPPRPVPQEIPVPGRRLFWAAAVLLIAVLGVAVTAVFGIAEYDRGPIQLGNAEEGEFHIVTAVGDVMHAGADFESGAILVGPPLGSGEDLTARLEFLPERATQQAGIMVFRSPDEYVKLGRHFNDRARLEFGYETEARYRKTPATFAFDESGQTGAPIWLKIRRSEDQYLGYVSSDGTSWRRFGERLAPPSPFEQSRLAIFGFNGRSNAPPTNATFSRIGIGLWFHDQGDPAASIAAAKDWSATPASSEEIRLSDDRDALLVQIQPTNTTSNWRLLTKVPNGDWTLETKLDFVSIGGAYAGLYLVGSSGDLRLIRWDLNGGSITLEHLVNTQVSVPDFAGNPPLTLRLAATDGVVRGLLSRDGTNFTQIDEEVDLASFGSDLRFGIVTGTSSWSDAPRQVESRFYYVQRKVTALEPFAAGR